MQIFHTVIIIHNKYIYKIKICIDCQILHYKLHVYKNNKNKIMLLLFVVSNQ